MKIFLETVIASVITALVIIGAYMVYDLYAVKHKVVGKTVHGFHRPDSFLFCQEFAKQNEKKYPGLVCPDPYEIRKWSFED